MRIAKKQESTVVKEQSLEFEGSKYEYKLSVSISDVVASYKLSLYSVSVKMTDADGNETQAVCADAFADIGKALIFFDKIVRYVVTPIDLAYVYEDEMK